MNRRNAGSALIVAMIFGIILVVAVGALVGNAMNEYRNATRSYMNTAALHLAEAGIERATCDVVKKESWTTAGTLTSDKSPIVSNYPGSYVMECAADPLDATKVIVRSLARVSNPGGSLQTERAIEAVFTKVLGTASGGIDMSLVSEKVTAQLSGQANELIEKGTKFVVGSYVSSDVNRVPPALSEVEKIGYEGGVKITGTETWTDWQGKTLSASELHNPVVFGDIEVNGVVPRTNSDSGNTLKQYTGTQSYDAAKEGTADEKTTPNINTNGGGYIYPPTDINVDGRVAGFVADSHNGTRPDQALFGGAAVTVETVNGVKIATIGEVGKKTYYEFEQLNLDANCELRVLGDVVLVIRKEMKSQPGGVLKIGAVGVDGDIIPDMTQPRANRAKLTIVAREKFHMDNNNTSTFSGDGLWLPDQLTVTGKYRMVTGSGAAVAEVEKNPFKKGYASSIPKSGTSTAEFVVHAGFTGVVNAPDNTLKLHGANNGLTIWGQVFGKDTQMTNGVRILYDPSINNKSSPDGDSLTLFSWRQIKPPANLRAELSR